jgi:glycosyltransferase involved in cell wall biosynthesis
MRILLITNHYLDGRGGGTVGSRGFINAFASFYNDCLLIYPDNGHDISRFVKPGLKIFGCRDNRPKWFKGIGIYFGVLHRFRTITKKVISEYAPDMVVFDSSTVSSGLIRYVKKLGIRTITIHHNVEMDYFRDNPPPILIRLPYYFYMRRAERDSVILSDLNLTHTDHDTEILLDYYARGLSPKIKCIGVLGTEPANSEINNWQDKPNESEKLIFVMSGSLSFLQSDISFINFIENYVPIMVETCKNMELIIAGSNPSERLVKVCMENKYIRLLQNPADMSQIVAGGDVYICPVDKGSGLKIRIMDGLKVGIPVLTHEVSARGYEHFIKTGAIYTYNSISTFKASLDIILNTKTDRREKIQEYRNYFSAKNGISRLKSVIE